MNVTFTPDDVLSHGVAEIIDADRIREALESGKSLKVKLGIDPTSSDVHLGRSIPLWRLRAFQELGCEIHLIIGDFTGQVGDTSDKDAERPMLTAEQIKHNLERYEEQLWMVLNPNKKDQVHFHHNSEWLGELSLGKLTHLADAFSVNSFIKRELVARRLEEGSRVSLREMLYPLMQGYDSVMIEADVELGGTDQRFNLLAGRTLQEQAGQTPQSIIMNVLISGLDGRKMSSSWGNVISLLDSPADKFGKMMTVRDEQMGEYLLVLPRSVWPFTAEALKDRLANGENPRDLKMEMARTLVALYHGEEEADRVHLAFIRQFSEGQQPEEMIELSLAEICETGEMALVDLVMCAHFAESRSDARRLIEQGGVRLNDEIFTDINQVVRPAVGTVLQVGKRKFARLVA